MKMVQVLRYRGHPLSQQEDALRNRLEGVVAMLRKPGLYTSKVIEMKQKMALGAHDSTGFHTNQPVLSEDHISKIEEVNHRCSRSGYS